MNRIQEKERFLLTVEYDGTRYSGWQIQADAKTVQGSILQSAEELIGASVDVQGNGRTDAGVHAKRFTAHLEAPGGLDLDPVKLQSGLNNRLPYDISILSVERVDSRFHARHHCVARSYLYQISKRKTVFCRRFCWWIPEPLDTEAMAGSVSLLVGMNDFSSFTDRQILKSKSPLVLVNKVQLAETEDLVLFRIIGSHFLWKMVRRIVGVLVAVGRGEFSESDVRKFLVEQQDLARYTAPPQGLFFERAFYDKDDLAAVAASDDIKENFF